MNMRSIRWKYTITDALTGEVRCDIISTRSVDGTEVAALCPYCNHKIICRLRPDSHVRDAGLWCPDCGSIYITIERAP